MSFDIVFPRNNEHELILISQKLGYSELFLAYEYNRNSYNSIKERFTLLQQKTRFKVMLALKVKPTQISETKKIANLQLCDSSDKNRWVLEKNSHLMLYNVEYQKKNDFIHQRNSGLNHILCTLAHQNNIQIGVSFYDLMQAEDPKKPILIGRIQQNARLCKKYKVNMVLASFASEAYAMRAHYDLRSFGLYLGIK